MICWRGWNELRCWDRGGQNEGTFQWTRSAREPEMWSRVHVRWKLAKRSLIAVVRFRTAFAEIELIVAAYLKDAIAAGTSIGE
jgi:hypothetical protein